MILPVAAEAARVAMQHARDAESGRKAPSPAGAKGGFRDPAFTANRDLPIHRWVPWIAGFSRDVVADALARFMDGPGMVLDPFAGVGTALIEADLAGHEAAGFEINPYAVFASRTKLAAHRADPARLRQAAADFVAFAERAVREGRAPHSVAPAGFRTRAPFYSPRVLAKVLLAFDFIAERDATTAAIFRLAFAATMVACSNYSYEPSLGRRAAAGRAAVEDFPLMERLAAAVLRMADDAAWYRQRRARPGRADARVFERSFLEGHTSLRPGSVDLIVTSPPYLNNYHYNRNTRPQLYWLGLAHAPCDLKRLEELNFGSYWQNARELEAVTLAPAAADEELRATLANIAARNPGKGLYGGRGWANYAARYFNDCARFAAATRRCLRPGGRALVVIGNSILQGVPVATDRFLAKIAAAQGLETVAIHTPRRARTGSSIVASSVRAGTANGHRLHESVVELRRP